MRAAVILLSLGLALSACRAPCTAESAPCTATGSLEHGGLKRTFVYHLPPGVRPGMPLLLSLHGRLGQGRNQADLSNFDPLADEAGFLVVYPDGIDRSWADGRGTTPADEQGVDDVGFLSALIDHFLTSYEVDPRRVYSAGMSNGGMMSYRLACELPERVTAIAPVAALMSEKLAARCAPTRPVPVVAFVGTEDELMPAAGGETSNDRGPVLSLEGTRSLWAQFNGCEPQHLTTSEHDLDPEDGTRVRREAHGGCREGAEVSFYVLEGGGHTWPGGPQQLGESLVGRTSRDLDASRTAWEFLQRFQRQ